MDRICDNDDSIDVGQMSSLINTVSNGKELSFSKYDIDGIIDCFDD